MRPSRSEYRALISLAMPIVIVQVGLMTMGVVDAIMVGRYSAEALAATALGNFYFFVVAARNARGESIESCEVTAQINGAIATSC